MIKFKVFNVLKKGGGEGLEILRGKGYAITTEKKQLQKSF